MDQPDPQQIETYRLKFSAPEPFAGLNAIKAEWLAEHGKSLVSWSELNKQLKRLSSRVVDLLLKQDHANAKVFAEYIETVEKRLVESTRKIQNLEKELAEQKAAPPPTLADSYAGVWQPSLHRRGAVVTMDGSLWIAKAAATEAKPGTSDDWQLMVKRGRDGKDLRPQ